jgi:hypothetical protein
MDFSIRRVISETLDLATERKLLLLKGVVPAAIGVVGFGILTSLGFSQFGEQDGLSAPSGWVFLLVFATFIITLLLFVKALVNSHRVYILNESPNLSEIVKWRGSDTLFLKASIKLILLYILLGFLLLAVISPAALSESSTEDGFAFGAVVATLAMQTIVAYVASRISVILPAAATDHRVTFSEAWTLTASHHLKLLVLVGIIPTLTNAVISLLPDFDSILYSIVLGVIWCMVTLLELGLLSVSYNQLCMLYEQEHTS